VRQSRKTLLVTTILLGVVAAAAIATVLFSTLRVSAKTDAELLRISLDDLGPGTWKFARYWPESRGTGWDIMLVRSREGRLFTWFVPVKEGKRRLPDGLWWKPGYACEFTADFDTGVIACSDAEAPDWLLKRSRWALDGRSLSNQTPNMDPAEGVEESGYFVVNKRP
jgi:hypothetical protein